MVSWDPTMELLRSALNDRRGNAPASSAWRSCRRHWLWGCMRTATRLRRWKEQKTGRRHPSQNAAHEANTAQETNTISTYIIVNLLKPFRNIDLANQNFVKCCDTWENATIRMSSGRPISTHLATCIWSWIPSVHSSKKILEAGEKVQVMEQN